MKLCSGLSNVKYLHFYPYDSYLFLTDRDAALTVLCKGALTNFLFPKLESLKSTFHSPSRSLYAVMFDKVVTPNKHTIKKLDWDLGNDIVTMSLIKSDLSHIEEFSLNKTGDSKLILDEYPLFMNVIESMKSLKKLYFNIDGALGWYKILMKLTIHSISSSSVLPQLQSIDGFYPFIIESSNLNDFQLMLDDQFAHITTHFNALIDYFGLDLTLRPFDLITMITEEGPFYPLGTKKGIYIKSHFSLDVKMFGELVMNATQDD